VLINAFFSSEVEITAQQTA